MKERRTWDLPATVLGDPNLCPIDVGHGTRCDKVGSTGTRGWCAAHYQRWRKTGEAGGPIRPKPIHLCYADGCETRVPRPGICAGHEAKVKEGERAGLRPCWHCLLWQPEDQFERKRSNGITRFCMTCMQARRQATRDAIGQWYPVKYPVTNGVKRCTRCKREQPIAEFSIKNHRTGQVYAQCKACRNTDFRRRNAIRTRRRLGLPLDTPIGAIPGWSGLPEGTRRYTSAGYVIVKVPGHPRATKRNQWVLEHVVVAEQKYGFVIPHGMTVHHKNDMYDDNRPENLELRVGKHGKHGDVVPTLLTRAEERSVAIECIAQHVGYRAQMIDALTELGYVVSPPDLDYPTA